MSALTVTVHSCVNTHYWCLPSSQQIKPTFWYDLLVHPVNVTFANCTMVQCWTRPASSRLHFVNICIIMSVQKKIVCFTLKSGVQAQFIMCGRERSHMENVAETSSDIHVQQWRPCSRARFVHSASWIGLSIKTFCSADEWLSHNDRAVQLDSAQKTGYTARWYHLSLWAETNGQNFDGWRWTIFLWPFFEFIVITPENVHPAFTLSRYLW